MANLVETSIYEPGIYQIEQSDPVMGGPNGISNKQAIQLGNRTLWLKNKIAEEVAAIGTSKANKATTLAGYGITNAYTSAQVDALLANKADKSVTIAAGTGLLSGGDLSSSRTLSIDKATAAQITASTPNKVVTSDILGPILTSKANVSNTLAGYGIANAYNKTEVDNLLSGKVSQSSTLSGYGITDGVTKKELLTIPATTASLSETIEKPISLVTVAAGDGMKDHTGFTYIRTTQYGGSTQYSQLAVPYSTASAPKLYGRHCYQGTETAWGRFDGADWNAAASETGYIYNKPTTLAGFGITDWVAKAYGGTGNIIADAIGNGVHSYGAGATDAATWLDGSSIGAQKMLQYGSAAWDSQIVTQAYGECTFIRSRRTANGAYQPWKRLDGADFAATEKAAGFIANKPTDLAGYGITDGMTTNTSQAITGVKTFGDTTGFLSTKLVGFSSWQDTMRLNGTLPVISNGSFGIGFHAPNRVIYFMDIEKQSYLATFSFPDNKATFTGAVNAAGGLFKGSIEVAYSNINLTAGTGLTGGGTLATNRAFAIDKAAASDITAGTIDKVLTTDILKPTLDAKANAAITITAGVGLTGGGSMATNRALAIDKATAADAAAGTSNKVMTADVLKPLLDASAPAGTITFSASSATPNGWLKANGTAVSRTTYAALFAAIGTTYGVGNGSTTFNLPDLRAQFPRFLDDGANIDTGRVLGSKQDDAIRNITGGFSGTTGTTPFGAFLAGSSMSGSLYEGTSNQRSISFDASRVIPTATENRPINIALIGLIKT